MYRFLVWELLQPYPILLLLIGLGIARLWFRPVISRKVRLLITLPYLFLLLLSMPAVSYLLRGSLEWRHTIPPSPNFDAIVVLSGGVYPADGPRTRAELDEDTLNRCLAASHLYREVKKCPIFVSGGRISDEPGPTCAEVMRTYLVQLGVSSSDVIVENQARTTYENAAHTARLLDQKHLKTAAVVTSALHLPRSVACFRKQEIDVVPVACQFRATPSDGSRYGFVPSVGALQDAQRVSHEWLGYGWYWLRGRV